jgi:hypothetical protein
MAETVVISTIDRVLGGAIIARSAEFGHVDHLASLHCLQTELKLVSRQDWYVGSYGQVHGRRIITQAAPEGRPGRHQHSQSQQSLAISKQPCRSNVYGVLRSRYHDQER